MSTAVETMKLDRYFIYSEVQKKKLMDVAKAKNRKYVLGKIVASGKQYTDIIEDTSKCLYSDFVIIAKSSPASPIKYTPLEIIGR